MTELNAGPHEVFDVRDPQTVAFRGWPPLMEWIRTHDVDPNDVYRIEWDTDAGSATFYRYARNADGDMFLDPATKNAAVVPPLQVAMKAAPPKLDLRLLIGRGRR